MKIRTTYMHPSLVVGDDCWTALDDDTYDGAEDSSNRHMIGYGPTEEAAIADLQRLMDERDEWRQGEQCCEECRYQDDEELRWRTETDK